jgi:diguanylate cyclase (GGDEF)-like protein/PAS domain S-box-containing protein
MEKAKRKAVLVVDDERQVLDAIEDTLEDEYRVLTHTSPEAAIRQVKTEPELAVILSDQRMPGMTGDEFLARAERLSDASRVIITGYADLEAVVRAVNHGHIFGYISKPWDPEALKLAVFKAAEHNRLLRELSEERRLLHNLMDNIPDAIFFKDLEHRFVRLNKAHAMLLGIPHPDAAVGRPTREFFPADEGLAREAEDEEIIRSGTPLTDKVRQINAHKKDGRWRSTTKAPIKDDQGKVIGLVGISRDVTGRHQAQEKIRRLNRIYAVLSGINAVIVRVREPADLYREVCRIAVEAGTFRLAWIGVLDRENARVTPIAWHGVDAAVVSAVGGRRSLEEPKDGPRTIVANAVLGKQAIFANDLTTEAALRDKGQYVEHGILSAAALPLLVSGEAAAVLVLHAHEKGFFDDDEVRLLTELAGDISFALEHIQKTRQLDYLSYYDALTGLANRALFLEHVGQACLQTAAGGPQLAVVLMDIERFKTINDTLGRQAGDTLLKQVGERIGRHAVHAARFARVGADQFAIMVPEVQSADELARWIERRIKEVVGAPFRISDTEVSIGAKLGIALCPGDGTDAETLFRNAEAALKKAKRSGERYLFYQQQMSERVVDHLRLETRLRRALEREEFLLYYQPKIELQNRRIVGMEALIRWRTQEGQLVPPGDFIPLMEETGMILEVGAWAMRKAALDHQQLVRDGIAAPRVAVNVSAIQLRKRDFVDTVKAAAAQGVSPSAIDLEITESLVMEDIAANIQKLNAIREFGVEIAIDDFGTGYSSLAYLAKLPVRTLKIDRSFIITMLDDPNTMTLVSTIISLAHSLKLNVVAEGVDSEEQAKVLRLLRCDQMQGYLFSKPVALHEMKALLART